MKPLSPSCFARAFPALASQFTLSLIFQGFAVKPLSLSSTQQAQLAGDSGLLVKPGFEGSARCPSKYTHDGYT